MRLLFMTPCLTDGSQSPSEVSRLSSQQEFNNQEDRGEVKEEARCHFMDFPARDVAEQLARLDSVGLLKLCLETSVSLSVPHSRLLCLRNSLSEWFPSTAWAASGLSATRKRTESWRPPCVQPFPSSTRWPTVSSPPFSARWLPVLPPHRPCRRPAPPPPSCTPPLTRTPLTLLTPAPPTEHASSRGGSPLLRSEIFRFYSSATFSYLSLSLIFYLTVCYHWNFIDHKQI